MKLSFEQLVKDYGGHRVFENICGQINSGDMIGLVGANGAGKTTLARILSGLETCDSGTVRCTPGSAKVLYSEQFPAFDSDSSVFDEVYDQARIIFSEAEAAVRVKKVLTAMGFDQQMWTRQAGSLSGGEKTKLSLCKAMVSEFDFLLLDEPSNHLDVDGVLRLEEYLQGLHKPVLIISHDRYFLDSVVHKIWELTGKGLMVYEGNYTAYKNQKEMEARNAEKEFDKQQDKIQRLKDMISDRKDWNASAHKAAGQNDFYRSKAKKHTSVLKAKERQLERLEQNKVEKPGRSVSPAFEVINKNISEEKLPPVLIRGTSLYKNYGANIIFDNASFSIARGEKIALVGENGTGKTTFLRMVCQLDRQYQGSISITPSVRIGYFSQQLDDLEPGASVLEQVLVPGITIAEARLLLASLLFKGDEVFKKISDLSMGEKGRVAFARLILSGANLLVLDEPTNFMDIMSREKIEEVLEDFRGAILMASHDRYFVKKLARRILSIKDRKILSYDGGYDYFLEKCREEQTKQGLGPKYKEITDNIRRLENQLAFLSGQLSGAEEEEEKNRLEGEFFRTACELQENKEALKEGRI